MPTSTKVIVGAVASLLLLGAVAWGWNHWSMGTAIDALEANNPTDAQIEVIAGLLADQSGKYRGRAEEKLRQVGARAVPALTNLSKNGDGEVRLTAAKLAAEIDPEGDGFAGLESVFGDPDVRLRRGAADILYYFIKAGELSDYPRPYELLLGAVDDPDPAVRERVVIGLGHLHTKEVKEALQKLAEDENRDVARAATQRLERRDSSGEHRGAARGRGAR